MKASFFPALALDSIRKNRRLYLPYFLTCAGMVMMEYIITYLQFSETLGAMRGGSNIRMMMGFGSFVIALFSLLLLFYTNSFLIRRRKKEFGLYNILGMGKRHISRILFLETLYMAIGSLAAGLVTGILLSKLAELGMVRILDGGATFTLSLSLPAVLRTVAIFGAIFLLLFLNGLRQVQLSSAIQLLRSENVGEKPPKANWAAGILGAVLLGVAYWMAITIQDPFAALGMFFVAVLLVIVATYLLMIAGSVLLCRILQKNKRYYYQSRHFVSVSSMAYRMKRNGAGLASICILATMVLVIVSSTTSLLFGTEDALQTRYPRECVTDFRLSQAEDLENGSVARLRQAVATAAETSGMTLQNQLDWRCLSGWGQMEGDRAFIRSYNMQIDSLNSFYFIPLEDYNRACGTSYTLRQGEALLYVHQGSFTGDSVTIDDRCTLHIVQQVDVCIPDGSMTSLAATSYVFILPELSAVRSLADPVEETTEGQALSVRWHYAFDTGLTGDRQDDAIQALETALANEGAAQPLYEMMTVESRQLNRADFLGTYGSLFYLGAILSVVFLAAAVEIIYYKQLTEGYEDQARFAIMQKVGMDRRDIRRSINSQLLTVFFLPLAGAGLHLAFAYPMIRQLLQLLNLTNLRLFALTTLISFGVFALFYTIVYRLTSNAYYHIVSDREPE